MSNNGEARRVLFVQYHDPLTYPPILNAIRVMAAGGWMVRVLGTRHYDLEASKPPTIDRVSWRYGRSSAPGWRQKLHYVLLTVRALFVSIAWRPDVAYVSDPMAAPIGLLIRIVARIPVIYHEHDAPDPSPPGRLASLIVGARIKLASLARACVMPNEDRARLFASETNIPRFRTCVVWNCPLRSEAMHMPETTGSPILYYHGSINALRLPETIVDALAMLPQATKLAIVGNETIGSRGYMDRFMGKARERGVADRIEWRGYVPRSELLATGIGPAIGLALMPVDTADVNMRYMAGASNKAFEYLAMGFPVLVTALPDWKTMYVDPGYGVACDPNDPASIVLAVGPLLRDADELHRRGESGRRRIQELWNYETQFQPMLGIMEEIAARRPPP